MAAMFRDIVVVRRRRAHAIHAACHMLTMIKRVFYACMCFCSYSYGALLGGLSLLVLTVWKARDERLPSINVSGVFFFIFSIVFLLPFQRKNPPRSQATSRCSREIFSNAIFEYANFVNLPVVLMADYSTLNWASKRFCGKGRLKAFTAEDLVTFTWHHKDTLR